MITRCPHCGNNITIKNERNAFYNIELTYNGKKWLAFTKNVSSETALDFVVNYNGKASCKII